MLLVHGFTGTPQSMRPWAEHLEAAGFAVSLPRLPGHGTHWKELNQTAWTDWYAHADAAFAALRARCDRVFVAGLSMGGTLGLRLAEQRGGEVAGLVLVNPVVNPPRHPDQSLPLLRLLIAVPAAHRHRRRRPGRTGDRVRPQPACTRSTPRPCCGPMSGENLDRVTQPLLVFRSEQDHVVDASSLAILKKRVGSADADFRTLTRSFHVATLDYEADEIFAASVEFFRRRCRPPDSALHGSGRQKVSPSSRPRRRVVLHSSSKYLP